MATKTYPDNSGDALKNLGDYLGTDEDGNKKYVPEGFESQQDFIDYAIKLYDSDTRYDQKNREWALEDLQFAAGDQWDERVKQDRLANLRPCLTINVLPQFIGQVVGDRRMNKVEIKVKPFRYGTQEVAEVRSGIIKSIELYSRAERAYDMACEDQVTCGIGNLRVDMEYAANDVFDQDIRISHVPNPLAVIWDRMSIDATAKDAKHCFVIDNLPKEVFEKNYPEAKIPTGGAFGFTDDVLRSTTWVEGDMVRLTEFWELIEKPALLALLQNGDVIDVTDGAVYAENLPNMFTDPKTGKPKTRKSFCTYARMHIITSFAILSECYEIPLTRLPIVRVEGRTIRVGEDRVRFGLTRFAKDSQRLKNYWRSKAAESIALAPQAQWIADAGAVEGREKEFRENARTGDPLLTFNKGAAEPKRVEPPAIPTALINEANMNQQDIKDTTGIHDASLGIQSNEVSGKAINARKVEGDVATVIYHDNLNQAILEVGDVCNQMIPICYDSVRILRVIGADDKHKLQVINDPENPNSVNVLQGKYDVVLDTGPNFATQREEALDGMMTLLQTAPELLMVIGDLVAENTDWPGGAQITERMRRFIGQQNPAVLGPDEQPDQGQPNPQQAEAAQAQQFMQQMQVKEGIAQLQHAQQMRGLELNSAQEAFSKAQMETQLSAQKVRQTSAQADEAEARAASAKTEAIAKPITESQKITHSAEQNNQSLQHAEDRHIQSSVQEADHHLQNSRHMEENHEQKAAHADQAAQHKATAAKQPKGKKHEA